MTADKLTKIIEAIVRRELQAALPSMISEALSEKFLRKIISESVTDSAEQDRPLVSRSSLREAMTPSSSRRISRDELRRRVTDDDDAPPLDFVSPFPVIQRQNKLLSADNPMRELYENVDMDEDREPDDVDISHLGLNPDRLRKINEAVDKVVASSRTDNVASASRSRKIAESVKVG